MSKKNVLDLKQKWFQSVNIGVPQFTKNDKHVYFQLVNQSSLRIIKL